MAEEIEAPTHAQYSSSHMLPTLCLDTDRYTKADMTPPWLSNAISAMKFVGARDEDEDVGTLGLHNDDITTLTEASQAQATVCVLKDTHTSRVIIDTFPGAMYLQCDKDEDCFKHLRYRRCVLFAHDELFLIHKDNEDPDYEVTRERFNTQ